MLKKNKQKESVKIVFLLSPKCFKGKNPTDFHFLSISSVFVQWNCDSIFTVILESLKKPINC